MINQYIDHTLLKPETTKDEISILCQEAIKYRFAAVCVPPHWVAWSKSLTKGTTIKVATVIGFPFGYSSTQSKLTEIKQAILSGADELDIVHNLCALHENDWAYLSREISECLLPIRLHEKVVKVIIESGILSDTHLRLCCNLYAQHRVDFVKTSTGYSTKGAGIDDVRTMRSILPAEIGIKASGGIKTYHQAQELVLAGATRIGTSSGAKIMQEKQFVKN